MLQAERKEVLKSVQQGEPFATGYQLLYRGVEAFSGLGDTNGSSHL